MATATLSCTEQLVPLFPDVKPTQVLVEQFDQDDLWLITVAPAVPCFRCGLTSNHFVATADDQQFRESECIVCHNEDEVA